MAVVALSAAGAVMSFVWWLFSGYFVSSTLDNMPGPPSDSMLGGTQCILDNTWEPFNLS